MTSTYTTNQGIEKPAAGDQSGTWGGTVNTNMDIIDRAICGVASLTLTGSTTTLTTTDGTLTDGMYRVLILGDGGDLGSDNTITISPNDQSKCYLVYNNLTANRNAIFTQGSGGNITVSNGATAWIYADGAGAGAEVRQGMVSTEIADQDGDTKIQVEEGGDDDDTIRFDIAGAEDFTMTANTLSVLSGSAINIDSGASIVNSGTATGFGVDAESAYAGVLETNANFVDQAIFGPSVDGKSWNGKWSVASLYSSLMLVTIEDTGADTEVNIWDLTEVSSSAPSTTPLGTVTLSGDATPTSVAACMGYIIIGSEDGISIIDPHSGSWAERTAGWPRSLSTSTTPALTDNDVVAVAARLLTTAPYDPRTGGGMPTFVIGYGTGADIASILKTDGVVYDRSGTVGNTGVAIFDDRAWYTFGGSGDIVDASVKIDTITADDWTQFIANYAGGPPDGLGDENAISFGGDKGATASDLGLTVMLPGYPITGSYYNTLNAKIDRTYNTGFYTSDIRGAWLANSATTDRSYKANTLTENGTVTEAAVESGAELMGYSGFDASNYFSRAYDADLDFGTGDFSVMGWFKLAASATYETLIDRGETSGSNQRWFLRVDNNGLMNAQIGDGTNNIYPGSSAGTVYDDDVWHQVILAFNGTLKTGTIYADGVQVATATDTNIGSLSNASAILRIGNLVNATNYPFNGTVALWRASATAPTAAQVRQMYDAEKGMFVASAECLLQSGSTDAVLDVDVDPLSGKVIVTQTDAITIFDGLAVDSKPTVNSGSSEKGKLWGALRAEQNSANAYVTAPAVDQRQVNEMVRGLASDLPAGVDLSKAKAWCIVVSGATGILGSYNIKSVTKFGNGQYAIAVATKFKSTNYVALLTTGTPAAGSTGNIITETNNVGTLGVGGGIRTYFSDNATTTPTDTGCMIVFFGELEGE